MDFDSIREYALKKEYVTESQPFGNDVLVFKVKGKIFLMMNFEIPFELSLKCDPELAMEYRERYNAIRPGYHMNKVHWNTVVIDGSLKPDLVLGMIDHSYGLIIKGLPKSKK